MLYKNVLVTGGAGFLGSNFVIKTLNDFPNVKVSVLDKLSYAGNLKNLETVLDKIVFIHGDILDERVVARQVAEADLVVHFAAETHNDNSLINPKAFVETNVLGTQNVALAVAKFQKRLHHVSTDEVFGDLPLDSDSKFHEDSPYRPSSPYSASKAGSDHIVRAYSRSLGLRATISNCSNNYGPNQHWEKLIPSAIRSLYFNKPINIYGSGKNVRDWIHVDDHSYGIWKIINGGNLGETYLLGASNEVSNLEIAHAILKAMKKDESLINFVEDRPGHDLRYAIDATKARNALSWEPKKVNFMFELQNLVRHYVDKLEVEQKGETIES